jgi:tetratricopeptide (TPR) repeat protein
MDLYTIESHEKAFALILLVIIGVGLYLLSDTASPGIEPVAGCGDRVCDVDESCSICPADCGACSETLEYEWLPDLNAALPQQLCDFESDGEAFIVASDTGNKAICACINEESTRKNCETTVSEKDYYIQAIESFDISLCEEIEEEIPREACKSVVSSGIDFVSESEPKYLAHYYNKAQNVDGAIALLETDIEENGDLFDPLITLTMAYSQKMLVEYNQDELFQTALDTVDRAIALSPESPVGYTAKGYLYEIQPDLLEAIKQYNIALEKSPDYIPAYIGRGHAYNKKGVLGLALADFEMAKQLDVGTFYQSIYANLCRLYASRGPDYLDDAIGNCLIVIETDFFDSTADNIMGAHITLADLYMVAERYDEAYTQIQEALVQLPNSPDAHVTLSKYYFLTEDYPMAEEAASDCLEEDPMRAACYYSLSRAQYMQDKLDDAIEAALKGLEVLDDDVSLLIPNKPTIEGLLYYQLANTYYYLGDETNELKYKELGDAIFS